MRVGLRLGRVGEAVLLCLLAYAEAGGSQLFVRQAAVARRLVRQLGNLDRSNANKAMEVLRRHGLLVGRGNMVRLSRRGTEEIFKRCLHIEKLAVPKSWDGRWRVVAFDVPDYRRGERDVLRRALKILGFAPLQKSVWAHPSATERQVARAVAAVGADRYVAFMIVETLNDDRALRKKFGL